MGPKEALGEPFWLHFYMVPELGVAFCLPWRCSDSGGGTKCVNRICFCLRNVLAGGLLKAILAGFLHGDSNWVNHLGGIFRWDSNWLSVLGSPQQPFTQHFYMGF